MHALDLSLKLKKHLIKAILCMQCPKLPKADVPSARSSSIATFIIHSIFMASTKWIILPVIAEGFMNSMKLPYRKYRD